MENPITSKEIFTSFSNANTFTAEILKIIFNLGFNIRSGNSNYQQYDQKFIEPLKELIISSEEFCRDISKKILFIVSDRYIQGYSARSIGALMYDKYEVYSTDVSLKLNGGFDPIYTKLVIKKTKDAMLRMSEFIRRGPAGLIVDIGDPYNEIFIGTYLNIAYDSGNFMHIPKLFGSFGCKGEKGYENYIISEKLNFTLNDVLTDSSPYFIKDWRAVKNTSTISNIFTNILFQVIYSLTYLKKCFRMRHFDVHLKNIMLKYVHDSVFKIQDDVIETVYQGKNLKNVENFVYEINERRVVVENMGLVAKIIDFGQSGVVVDQVEMLNDGFMDFHSGIEAYDQTNNSASEFYSMEFVFMLINFYKKFIENIKDNYKILGLITFLLDGLVDQENGELINDNITRNILPVHEIPSKKIAVNTDKRILVSTAVPTGRTLNYPDKDQGTKAYNNIEYKVIPWFMNRRNVAVQSIKNPEEYFLDRFLTYLQQAGNSNGNTYWITLNGKQPAVNNNITFSYDTRIGRENEMIKYYKHFSYYNNVCNDETVNSPNFDELFRNMVNETNDDTAMDLVMLSERNQKCLSYKKLIVDKYDPAGYVERPLFTHSITKKSQFYKRGKLHLDENISPDMTILKGSFLYNFIEINPGTLDIPYLDFSNKQLWTNYLKPNKNLIGTPVWNVRLHLFRQVQNTRISFNMRESLWDVAVQSPSDGLFINGGFFIVDKNVRNPLGLTVQFSEPPTANDIYTPIGFYKDATGANTVLNVPFGYESDFAAITVRNNNLHITKYTDFLNGHETDESVQLIQFKDDRVVKVKSQVIRVRNGKPVMKPGLAYDLAFVSGPILIWDGKVVFNKTKYNSHLQFNNKLYKILPHAKNSQKFYAEEAEKDFVYGQRHSNVYMNHNVLCQDYDGNVMIFLLEGRGYDAPGLTRLQLTNLIAEFGVKTAVSLDGGFSAQAIVKEEGELDFVLHDPEKRRLGLSLSFTIQK